MSKESFSLIVLALTAVAMLPFVIRCIIGAAPPPGGGE